MIWDSNTDLRIRLAAKCFSYPHYYRRLANWLGVYTYINPDQRSAGPEVQFTTRAGLFSMWQFFDLLNTSFTYQEQVAVWQLISESSTSVTLVS